MKRSQLYKAIQKFDYLILTNSWGNSFAINTRVQRLKRFEKNIGDETELVYTSFKPCSFDEYIRLKIPFIV